MTSVALIYHNLMASGVLPLMGAQLPQGKLTPALFFSPMRTVTSPLLRRILLLRPHRQMAVATSRPSRHPAMVGLGMYRGGPASASMSSAGPPRLARRIAVRGVESAIFTMARVALGTARLPILARPLPTMTRRPKTAKAEVGGLSWRSSLAWSMRFMA